ncbi:hypothetical protein XIS1_890022 [Xenorhabdus innexi]|uniref:Uncharacterized protein n=1 Tax=Xenorhabdus innexi TaxID=290109 RepID=A0A1N6N1G8_9GAMM|nr:hypothetical protein XIS1_890022 [Xenorhabdus innexi]
MLSKTLILRKNSLQTNSLQKMVIEKIVIENRQWLDQKPTQYATHIEAG